MDAGILTGESCHQESSRGVTNKMDALAVPTQRGMKERSLVDAWLSGRSPETMRAYGADLRDFAQFLGASDLDAAGGTLLSQTPGAANAIVLEYRTYLIERELSPATINRRLASLRSLVKLARTLGLVTWSLEIGNLRSQPYRDTKGPGVYLVRRMLEALEARGDTKGSRDVAILRLLFDLGLRRGEVTKLDLADLDVSEGTLKVLGKGRLEQETLRLPGPTQKALTAWIGLRGPEPGPLFLSHDRAGKGAGRLDGSSVYRLVRKVGEDIGIQTRPHAIRHSAVTEACKAAAANGMDLTEVLPFSRHRNVGTLQIYRDRERDTQGKLAKLVAGSA